MPQEEERVKSLFNEFDEDKDGVITPEELKNAIKRKSGKDLPLDEIMKIIEIIDRDKSNTIDYEEFHYFYKLNRQWNTLGLLVGDGMTDVEKIVKTLTAGAVAGAVSRSVVSPFERIKILFQTQPAAERKYKGVFDALVKIYQEEGIRGYFKGNGANVVRIAPASAIQYFSFEQYKKLLLDVHHQYHLHSDLHPVERVLVGGMAGITALVVTYPLDFVRALLTVQTKNTYKGIAHAMAVTVANGGPMALYKGLWPSICGIVPYVGFDFAVYETLKPHVKKRSDGSVDTVSTLFIGGLAGTVAQTLAYPLDLIRRKIQVQNFVQMDKDQFHFEQYKGMNDAFRKIWRKEGISGFYRGLLPNYIKVVPSIAVSFLVYERMKEFFGLHRKH